MNSKHLIFGAAAVAGLGLYVAENRHHGFNVSVSDEITLQDALRVEALGEDLGAIDIAFMPNGTCKIPDMSTIDTANYKDYVRACLNNRRLSYQIN